jgi:hypothetical protein
MALFDLFRPKWKHSDPDVRVAAAKELTDRKALLDLAANDPEWFVRHEVFAILRDNNPAQEEFAWLARNSSDEEIRRKAIKRLTDEPTLEAIAGSEKYRYVRDAAEHRLDELRGNVWGEKSEAESSRTAGQS